ncbi:MAG: hypothetical protein P4M09_22540 [Devosia sp.]|nr:hypothetical protein [Devosia sp.]
MVDSTYQTKIQERQGGNKLAVASGGTLDIESGGTLAVAGIDRTAALASAPAAVAAGYKIARGQLVTVTAADTVATGLTTVASVVVSFDSDPADNPEWVTSTVGDQAGAPVAGSVIIKTWQNIGGSDPTPTAATAFGQKVNWIAVGT